MLFGHRGRMLATLVVVLLCGCSADFAVDNCDLACTSSCPDGFTCESGFCVRPGFDADQCRTPLSLSGPVEIVHFACEPLEQVFKAVDGRAGFRWELESDLDGGALPAALRMEPVGRNATLRADAGELAPGFHPLKLVLEDGQGEVDEQHLDLNVRQCPSIVLADYEPEQCVNGEVDIDLDVVGGFGEGHHEFSVQGELPPGLELDGTTIRGTLEEASSANYPETYSLTVALTDVDDPDAEQPKVLDAEPVELTLQVDDCVFITVSERELLCFGQDQEIELTAAGGTPPYAWTVENLPSQFEYDEDELVIRESTERVGTPQEIELTVEDADGRKDATVVVVNVAQCPVILPTSLEACVDDEFTAELNAESPGGTVEWRKLEGPEAIDVLPEGAVRWTPTEPLRGRLLVSATELETGATSSAELPVEAFPASSAVCFDAVTLQSDLPDACGGQLYTATLTASGGTGSYNWSEGDGWPIWLSLDAAGRVSGIPPHGSTVVLGFEVQIGSDGMTTQEVELTVRESCKFAFIGSVGESSARDRLFLGDIRQGAASEFPAVELSVELDAAEHVTFFELSPDAHYAAFTSASSRASEAEQLWIAPTDAAADVHGRIAHPEGWQLSEVLRVGWSPQGDYLASISRDAEARTWLSTFTSDSEFAVVDSVEIDWFASDGMWWLGEHLCYFGRLDGEAVPSLTFACHQVSDGVIGALRWENKFQQDQFAPATTQLASSGSELFVFDGSGDAFELYTLVGEGGVMTLVDQGFAVPDPSLTWLARPHDGSAGIFNLARDKASDPPFAQAAVVESCERVVAWQRNGRALACAAGDDLVIALIDAQGTVSREQTVADAQPVGGLRRSAAFDDQLDWFVYDADPGVFAVDLGGAEWTSQRVADFSEATRSVYALDRSGRFLIHHGNAASLLELGDQALWPLNEGQPIAPPLQCNAELGVAGPRGWCGGVTRASPAVVLGSHDGLAVVDSVGRLYSKDLRTDNTLTPSGLTQVNNAVLACHDTGCGDVVRPVIDTR